MSEPAAAGDAAPAGRAVHPRNAASLLLLRGDGPNPEVLLGRRASRHRFMPNVYVFPGGRLDRQDWRAPVISDLRAAVAHRVAAKSSPGMARALANAALRETYEETGISLGEWHDGVLHGDLVGLDYVARAITPPPSPVRFHARFFTARAETANGAAMDSRELGDLQWLPLDRALKLDIADVTEFVLQEVQRRRGGWRAPGIPLFSYRHGKPCIQYE